MLMPLGLAPMTTDLTYAIDAWKNAVAEAEAAQKLLDETWHCYLDRRGPAATDGLVKEVAQFRSRAEARLNLVLALMKSIGDESPSTVVPFMHKAIDTGRSDPMARSSRPHRVAAGT
jgi:hypothetical protein